MITGILVLCLLICSWERYAKSAGLFAKLGNLAVVKLEQVKIAVVGGIRVKCRYAESDMWYRGPAKWQSCNNFQPKWPKLVFQLPESNI